MYTAEILRVDRKPPKSKGVEFNMEHSSAMAVPHNTKGVGHLQAKELNNTFLDHDTEKVRVMAKRASLKVFLVRKRIQLKVLQMTFKSFKALHNKSPGKSPHPSLKNANCVQACAHQDWVSVSQVHAWRHMVTVLSRQLLCTSWTPYLPFFAS